jgi:transketolase
MTSTAPAPAGQSLPTESTRDAYRRTLLALAIEDPALYVLDSDVGGLEDTFGTKLPAQFVNLGIAEANLMSVAAGLAQAGKTVFVNTMATFASTRATEQLKIDVAGNNLAVKIVATHGGLSAAYLGPTHWALEDLAILRTLPNMTVVVPADVWATEEATRAIAAAPGPVYLRLDRGPTPTVHTADTVFELGRALEVRPGADVTIIATGALPVLMALEAHVALAGAGISARVLDMHTVKPIDVEAIKRAATETAGIVTVEDHNVLGGLGSAVSEVVTSTHPCTVVRIGVVDTAMERVGGHGDLLAMAGVTAERVCGAARSIRTGGRA